MNKTHAESELVRAITLNLEFDTGYGSLVPGQSHSGTKEVVCRLYRMAEQLHVSFNCMLL